MKSKEIKVPKRLSDTTLKQVWWFAQFAAEAGTQPTIEQRIEAVSYFSGLTVKDLMRVDLYQINEIFAHIVMLFNTEQAAPPEQVIVNGSVYTFRGKRLTAGQFVDWETSDKSPEALAAICYVMEGIEYAEVDQNGRLVDSLKNRATLFRDHFPGDVYYHLSTFFLHYWNDLQNFILVREKNRMKVLMRKARRLGGMPR